MPRIRFASLILFLAAAAALGASPPILAQDDNSPVLSQNRKVKQDNGAAAAAGAAATAQRRTAPDIPTAPDTEIEEPGGPPVGSLSLSQIVKGIEGHPDFAYVTNLDWTAGRYDITYVTRQGEERQMLVDPRTGKDSGRLGPGGGTPSDAPATDVKPAGPVR